MTRVVSYTLSVLLHLGVILGSLYWPVSQTHIDLNVPVYQVDLVTLAGAPGKPGEPGDPGPGDKPEVAEKQIAQAEKPAPPEAKQPPAPKVQAKPEPKPEPKAEKPPPDRGKDISAQKKPEPKKPEPKKAEPKKAEPKKPEPKKPDPEPKPEPKKTEPKPEEKQQATAAAKPKQQKQNKPNSREQILAQALQTARKDAAKQDKQDRDVLAKELADLRDSVTPQGSGGGTGSGSAGQGGQGGQGGQAAAYLRAVAMLIKERWSFPRLEASRVLTSTVEMRLDRNGEILDYQLLNSSGRSDFDASTLKAVAEAQQFGLLPTPPKGLNQIRINFNSQELQ